LTTCNFADLESRAECSRDIVRAYKIMQTRLKTEE